MYGDLSLQFPKDFYENVENVQVITFYNMQYPRLPRSLQCSTNLTSLCLYKCILMFDCSIVGDLVNLEVLSFAHCGICMLPSTIGNLKKLKLLDLTGCTNLHIDDGVFKNLKRLEELYMTASNKEGIRFTQANIEELNMLSGNLCVLEVEFVMEMSQLKQIYSKKFFKKLNKFKMSIGCMLEVEDKDDLSSKNTLKVVMDSSSDLLDWKVNKLFKKTEKLHLQVHDMIALKNIVSDPSYIEHSFQNLRELEVSNCVHLKYLFPISVASGLKTLEYLTVRSCFVLETLVYDNNASEIRSGGEFKKLKSLRLKDLPKLVTSFLVDNVFELPELVELHVYGLPNFTSIYPDKNGISAVLNTQVKTAKLEKLKIGHMKKLEQIWDCSSEEEVNNISMLREIEVEGCDSLVNLFPTNPMRLLSRLEKITVTKCGSIEVLFDIDLACVDEKNQVCNSSLRSINVQYLEKLRMVWRIKSGENNSTLLCRDFKNLERIKIDNCKRFRSLFTPSNIDIDLRALMDIRICGCRDISVTNEKKIEFWSRKDRDDNDVSSVAFPFNLMHTFHSLNTLYIGDLNDVEVVFDLDNATTNTQQPILPNLQHLRLHDLKSMSHVWEWRNDWNKFLILRERSSFHNLTTINMMECKNIRFLFSPLMAKLLFNLKKIEIIWCDGMEEVVSNKDDDEEEINSSTYPHTNTYLFPHLHLLKFEWLKNLKCIGGGGGAKDTTSVVHDQFEFPGMGHVIPWSLCQYSREMYIKGCHGLSSVVPYYATPHMQKLQVLEVYSCESLREVFEAQENDDHNGNRSGSSSTDTTTTTTAIPRRENIIVPQLSNLKKLVITHCDLLQHVLTFSTLESLKKLEELMIQECEEMNVIVKQEENGTTTPNVVVFPRLKTLKLLRLPNLKGFFLGSNDFEWPLLEKVTIMECPQIVSFTDGHSTAPKLEYIQTSLGKYNLDLNFRGTRDFDEIRSEGTSSEPLRWSFRDLIEIDMNDDWEVKGIIPSDKLLQLQKLERIRAYNCCCVKEVFEVAGVVKHKHITPSDRFDESHSVVEISNLKQVELYSLASLEYIWESNHQHKTILLSFPNLTTLSIDKCNSLKHVFTSSMVDSLAQLQHLHITHCKNMEVVVKEETRVKYDAKVKEIVLPYLKSLKLEKLKSIKGFCLGDDDFNWPLLHTLKINECPEIMVFSKGHVATPTLDIIDTCFGRCYLEGDINSFLKTKQHEGFQF